MILKSTLGTVSGLVARELASRRNAPTVTPAVFYIYMVNQHALFQLAAICQANSSRTSIFLIICAMSVHGKVIVRKSRKGNVQLIAREHYLRDDLSTGVGPSDECPVSLKHRTSISFQSSNPIISTSKKKNLCTNSTHYVTWNFLNQMNQQHRVLV